MTEAKVEGSVSHEGGPQAEVENPADLHRGQDGEVAPACREGFSDAHDHGSEQHPVDEEGALGDVASPGGHAGEEGVEGHAQGGQGGPSEPRQGKGQSSRKKGGQNGQDHREEDDDGSGHLHARGLFPGDGGGKKGDQEGVGEEDHFSQGHGQEVERHEEAAIHGRHAEDGIEKQEGKLGPFQAEIHGRFPGHEEKGRDPGEEGPAENNGHRVRPGQGQGLADRGHRSPQDARQKHERKSFHVRSGHEFSPSVETAELHPTYSPTRSGLFPA